MQNAKELQAKIEDLEAKIADLLDQRAAVDADRVKFNDQLGTALFNGKQNEALEKDLAKCQWRAGALDAAIKHGQGELAKAKTDLFQFEKAEAQRAALDEMGAMESELSELLHAITEAAEKMPKWIDRLQGIDALAKRYAMTDVHELYSIVYSSIPFEQLRGISQQMARNQVYSRNKRR